MKSDLDEYVKQYIKKNNIQITEEMKLVIREGVSLPEGELALRIAKMKEELRNL